MPLPSTAASPKSGVQAAAEEQQGTALAGVGEAGALVELDIAGEVGGDQMQAGQTVGPAILGEAVNQPAAQPMLPPARPDIHMEMGGIGGEMVGEDLVFRDAPRNSTEPALSLHPVR